MPCRMLRIRTLPMGHANVSTTLGIYTHLFEKKEEEDKLASALGDMLTKSVEK